MPTYDYSCPGCGWKGELYAYLAEADDQTCQRCGRALRKLFSPPRARHVTRTAYQKRMRATGHIEVGDATPNEIKKECDRWAREREEKFAAETEAAVGEMIQDLGEGLYDNGLPSNEPPPPPVEQFEGGSA